MVDELFGVPTRDNFNFNFGLKYSRDVYGRVVHWVSAPEWQFNKKRSRPDPQLRCLRIKTPIAYLLSVKQPFCILVFGLDQELATKWLDDWFTGLILSAFCTIFRAWPV